MSTESPREHVPAPQPVPYYPHNTDAERQVLGGMLIDSEVIGEIMRFLKPEDFYQSGHQLVFKAIQQLVEQDKPVDLTLLADTLTRHGDLDAVGGYVYLANLIQMTESSSSSIAYARLVQEKSTMRRLMAAGEAILREASEEKREARELIETAERLVFEVSQVSHSAKFTQLQPLLENVIKEVIIARESREPAGGLKSGFQDLDGYTGGFEPTALIILAARPSIGKTAFALNLVRNVAMIENKAVGFFSLEMGAEQLTMRLLCSEARLSNQRVRRGMIKESEWEELRNKSSIMMDMPIFIDDSPDLNLMQLRSRARRLKARRPDLGLLVVDYLQLMQSPPGHRREQSRQQEVSEISRGLKQLAKELNTPVLALSQLSRNIEQRGGGRAGETGAGARPMLSDLRESGAIEQDADVVMFVHRERREQQPAEEQQNNGRAETIPTEIIVGKNRNGPTGTAKLLFFPDFTLFTNALEM